MKLYLSRTAGLVMTLAAMFLLNACSPTAARVETGSVANISGSWNDTDSRLVAEEMIRGVLSSAWLDNFYSAHGKSPMLIVGTVRNLSREYINTDTFIDDMERELINSGNVGFIASSTEREEIREKIKQQGLHVSAAMRKAMGRETGTDYLLTGSINTIVDAISGEQARFYQVDLTLIELDTNHKVWSGQKKIRKTLEKSGVRI